jgi:hypothetical protein
MTPLRVADAIAALGASRLIRVARTANTNLVAADRGSFVDITAGTFSQTFTAAATLTSGWFVWLRNSGTGDITLDPNGAELIDGLASYIMYPGETRLVQCTGTAFTSIVVSGFSKTFTASGTFTKPPGYLFFEGILWAGGGGGGKSGAVPYSGGGGGGCANPFTLLASSFAATETITIGAGGIGSSVAGVGTVGGTSTIGSLVESFGGGGGSGNASNDHGAGAGGGSQSAGGDGNLSLASQGGLPANSTSLALHAQGTAGGSYVNSLGGPGNADWGGASGGASNQVPGRSNFGGGGGGGSTGGVAGVSKYGGAGGAGSNSASGSNGAAPGGGGGGTRTGTKGGDGARGELRIWGVV